MLIETNLIELRRVTSRSPVDVEYIRTVRNSFLHQNVYQDNHVIERKEHESWFSSLDSEKDYFFVIVEKSSQLRVGITGCYQKKASLGSGEVSIYITEASKSLMTPFHAMALLLRFMFETVSLDRAFGVFLKTNKRALRFNASFGFTKFYEDDEFIKTELTVNGFREKINNYRRFLL